MLTSRKYARSNIIEVIYFSDNSNAEGKLESHSTNSNSAQIDVINRRGFRSKTRDKGTS